MLNFYNMLSLFSFVATMTIMQVSASAATTPMGIIHGLTRRQSDTFDPNDIPVSCKSQCALISDTLSRCQARPSVGCDCTIADEAALVTCLECVLALAPSPSLTQQAQDEVDNFVATCASVGFPIPATKLSGASPTGSVTRAGGGSPSASVPAPAVTSIAGSGSRPTSPDPIDPLSQSLFQPSPTTTAPADSGNSGSNSGPLPGMKNAARRTEVGVTGVVLSALACVIFF